MRSSNKDLLTCDLDSWRLSIPSESESESMEITNECFFGVWIGALLTAEITSGSSQELEQEEEIKFGVKSDPEQDSSERPEPLS